MHPRMSHSFSHDNSQIFQLSLLGQFGAQRFKRYLSDDASMNFGCAGIKIEWAAAPSLLPSIKKHRLSSIFVRPIITAFMRAAFKTVGMAIIQNTVFLRGQILTNWHWSHPHRAAPALKTVYKYIPSC